MWLYVFDKGCAFLLHHSAFQAESNCSLGAVTQSRLPRWCWNLVCMRASTVSHANTGVTCVRGQPWLLTCLWRKTLLLLFIFNSMHQQGKTQLHSAASLKRVNRSNHRDYKAILWGLLLANLEELHNLYILANMVVSSPWTSPPVSLSLRLSVSSPAGPAGKFFSEGLSTTV